MLDILGTGGVGETEDKIVRDRHTLLTQREKKGSKKNGLVKGRDKERVTNKNSKSYRDKYQADTRAEKDIKDLTCYLSEFENSH